MFLWRTIAKSLALTGWIVVVKVSNTRAFMQIPLRLSAVKIYEKLLLESTTQLHQSGKTYIALTRERGKNGKLEKKVKELLEDTSSVELLEIPCISFEDGTDTEKLPKALMEQSFDYICITSPEAATVFAEGWKRSREFVGEKSGALLGKIAAVGKATEQTLKMNGFDVSFVPTKATAACLVLELPLVNDDSTPTTVLYPASERAATTLQDGLTNRGMFEVTRLNTYNTVPAKWTSDELELAKKCKIACFGSPSAVKAWISNQGEPAERLPVACIGETSATACREMHWEEDNIFYPDSPGIDGWANAVVRAKASLNKSLVN